MYLDNVNATMASSCELTENSAITADGGAIYLAGTSALELQSTKMSKNTAGAGTGAGIGVIGGAGAGAACWEVLKVLYGWPF